MSNTTIVPNGATTHLTSSGSMIKIGHFSDLHYAPANQQESDRCFSFAVEDAIQRDIDVAVVTGDSTDHQLPAQSPSLLMLAKRVKQLADHCPVMLLQGTFTHEPAGMLHMLGLIGAKYPIMIADRIGMVALSENKWVEFNPQDIAQMPLQVVITCVPTVNKADLAILVGAEHAAEEMGNHLASLMASYGEINGILRNRGIPTVLVSHGTVDGSMTEHGVPMAGLDHEFTLGALFSANTDAVMLGHIHKHQSWIREHQGVKQVIAYSGSIGRFHYGEYGEKHYLCWDVRPAAADFVAVVTPSRKMIDLEFSGIPNLDELATIAKDCEGAYVRVRYTVDEEYASTVDRKAIKDLLASAIEVKIEGSVLTVQRQRCAGISMLGSTQEKFAKWAELSDTPPDGLGERVTMLETMTPEEIVGRVLAMKPESFMLSSVSQAPPEYIANAF